MATIFILDKVQARDDFFPAAVESLNYFQTTKMPEHFYSVSPTLRVT